MGVSGGDLGCLQQTMHRLGLGPDPRCRLTLAALNSALAARAPPEGPIHHSDRGVQYASKAYVDTLGEAGIRISMSRRGNPYDNAKAERFIRTLKYEEVYLYEYASLEEARSRIGYFIDKLMQSQALALGPGLQATGRVRADDPTC